MFSKLPLTAAVVSAGKCPFGFDKESSVAKSQPKVKQSSAAYPSEIFTCAANDNGQGIATTVEFTPDTYKSIFMEVVNAYEAVDDTVSANTNPRAKFAGCVVRAGGHDFMDFRVDSDGVTSGGSDGCIDFADADNTGLADCLEATTLADVYANHC